MPQARKTRCLWCDGSLSGRQQRFCSDNCRKRYHDDTVRRDSCDECGKPLTSNSLGRYARCPGCHAAHQLEHSTTAQILKLYNAGATHHAIAAELGISVPHVGQMLHRVRYTEEGKPYIKRYGFPEYRRTPEQRARIRAGSLRGLGKAA